MVLLIARRTRLSTAGDRAFPVAAARVCTKHHATSRLRRPCEFSAVVSRLNFSAVPFPTFRSACKVTRVIIGLCRRFC